MTEIPDASLDVPDMGAVYGALEARIHGYDDFQLGCRVLAETPAAWNELGLSEVALPGDGIGIVVESRAHDTLSTTDIELKDGVYTSHAAFLADSQAGAQLVGIWPTEQQIELHEVIEPIGHLTLDTEYPAAVVFEHVLEHDPDVPMVKVSGDDESEPALYTSTSYANWTDFRLTDETGITAVQVLTGDKLPEGRNGNWVRVTLHGKVHIMGGVKYTKVDADGTVYESAQFDAAPQEATLPAELSTIVVPVPHPDSQVHIKDRQLIAVDPEHEDLVDDLRTIRQLALDVFETRASANPLLDAYGMAVIKLPPLGRLAHQLIADSKGWRVSSSQFRDTYRRQIESYIHEANVSAAHEAVSTRLQARLATLHDQELPEPRIRGAIAVAEYIRPDYLA